MTVSLVLNSADEGRVSAETRERVLQAVRDLGYRPPARRVERHAPTVKTVGVLSNIDPGVFAGEGYASMILRSLFPSRVSRQLNVLLFSSHLLSEENIHQNIRVYCDGRCDGLVVIAPSRGSLLVPALRQRGTPFVVVGTSDDAEGPDGTAYHFCVDIDNAGAARAAVQHLVAFGHRRIAFAGGPSFVVSAEQRRVAYRRALADAGIVLDPRLERAPLLTEVDDYAAVADFMRLPAAERPTALFCWNDNVALTALRALRHLRIRVPEDVSVIGIDDSPESAHTVPALTTFRQPWAELGALAMNALLAQVSPASPEDLPPAPRLHLLPAELVVRASTGPAPEGP